MQNNNVGEGREKINLGMWISRNIINTMGGDIEIYSS
jgi:hypothetical protein